MGCVVALSDQQGCIDGLAALTLTIVTLEGLSFARHFGVGQLPGDESGRLVGDALRSDTK